MFRLDIGSAVDTPASRKALIAESLFGVPNSDLISFVGLLFAAQDSNWSLNKNAVFKLSLNEEINLLLGIFPLLCFSHLGSDHRERSKGSHLRHLDLCLCHLLPE